MSDYQSELTTIYNKLTSIQSTLSKLALLSRVNTIQGEIQSSLNSLLTRMASAEELIRKIQITLNDVITEVKKK